MLHEPGRVIAPAAQVLLLPAGELFSGITMVPPAAPAASQQQLAAHQARVAAAAARAAALLPGGAGGPGVRLSLAGVPDAVIAEYAGLPYDSVREMGVYCALRVGCLLSIVSAGVALRGRHRFRGISLDRAHKRRIHRCLHTFFHIQ